MGSNSKEMNIDLNIVYVPKLISDVLTEVSAMDDISKKLTKLNQFLVSLEEELRKIEAFKRELPFCMVLLKDAIERLKEEALQYKEKDKRPVMEEFIPLKKGNSDESGRVKKSNDLSDKKNWMSSAQLWSTPVQYESFDLENKGHFLHLKSSGVEEKDREKRYQLGVSKLKSDRGAFLPFQEQGLKEGKNGLAVKDLSLSMAVAVGEGEKGQNPIDASVKRDNGPSNSSGFLQDKSQQRKQRRCWSPELHRRFVDALHQLGGAQVATPKQIRDIMQVDGLTNDEVKSHLQKYRLHVRRIPISGCSWSNMDDSKTNGTQSGSPEGPLHFTGSGSAKGVSINEEEDNKSESYNWNGHLQKSIEAHV